MFMTMMEVQSYYEVVVDGTDYEYWDRTRGVVKLGCEFVTLTHAASHELDGRCNLRSRSLCEWHAMVFKDDAIICAINNGVLLYS